MKNDQIHSFYLLFLYTIPLTRSIHQCPIRQRLVQSARLNQSGEGDHRLRQVIPLPCRCACGGKYKRSGPGNLHLCPRSLKIAQALRAIDLLDWEKLDVYLDRFGSGAVFKRLGYLVEVLGTSMPDREFRLAGWKERLTQGIAWLEPGGEQTGPVVTRWQIRVNSKALEETDDL
jgi:hypothetical protein